MQFGFDQRVEILGNREGVELSSIVMAVLKENAESVFDINRCHPTQQTRLHIG